MTVAVNDKTTGYIVGPDGAPLYRPTTLMGADTASIMRAYFFWAISNQLEPSLFCKACNQGRFAQSAGAQFNITETEIQIVCDCQIRAFIGASLPEQWKVHRPSVTLPQSADQIGQIVLSEDVARLLRQYKKVLMELNLVEALRCNACYSLEQGDGCDASVTTSAIRIDCRCSHRRYQGLTI